MLSGAINHQENLGAAIADRAGMVGVQALKAEAACASAAAALKVGVALVASGACESVVAVGAEKMTDVTSGKCIDAIASAADFETEVIHGVTFTGLGGLLTSLYCEQSGASPEELARFVLHAHSNAKSSKWAMFRNHHISMSDWQSSRIVASPLRLLDCPAICDGAAAVVIQGRNARDNRHALPIDIVTVHGISL